MARFDIGRLFRASWRDLRAARQQDGAYRRTWQAFRQHRVLADGRHDTEEWRSHGGAFAACLIRVPAEALQPALDELREALQPYPHIRIHPDGFLHVMLQELGFITERPANRFEISIERLDEFVSAATVAVGEATSFDLRLGGANSFQDACFLDVHDRGACSRLHARLHELAAIPVSPKYAYLPHMTVAHYTGPAPIGNLPATIARFRDRRFGTIAVSQIEIVTMATDVSYPPFETYATIRLAG
ncbi:MAG TPA: 2'-5' RNA ligase family protein [Thermomicrobiales bacterium]